MKATVKTILFLNATNVVKINNPNPQFKLRIGFGSFLGQKIWSYSDFRILIAIPSLQQESLLLIT